MLRNVGRSGHTQAYADLAAESEQNREFAPAQLAGAA